ncbi:sensor histidine kinase [Thermodesulfatator autotrophicus]|uniref:histidine kinase n=1 Tax=Thermodesulfatator autotrophicus TaxID=1795632 RepID=A0A177E6W1_9BACT|nr:HAMP domain-containing sensor histidine kinase [Thermodesulfatator autotrophicus]OAG27180.1 hypothetical protein TH606_08185 [Thermodesulfatator autotrophicus]
MPSSRKKNVVTILTRIKAPWGLVDTQGNLIEANEIFLSFFNLKKTKGNIHDLLENFSEDYGFFKAKRKNTDMPLEGVIIPYEDGLKLILIKPPSRNELEQFQMEKLAAMGNLAGHIAHEINNPLGGILLYANLLKEDLPSQSLQADYVNKIIKLATRCRIIAKALLNVGRRESGTFEQIDFNRLIINMFSLVEEHRLFKEIDIIWELDHTLPLVHGNSSQLEQLVLNLITNAAEALEGKGRIIIRTSYLSQEDTIIFEVEDNGPGIPAEIRPRIFEPFFTTKSGGKGTGLGLAICYGIVKRHQGEIQVETRPGQTIFRVKLPRVILNYE